MTIDDSALFHGTYDPVKAREYYLRTRELKGRKKGTQTKLVGREARDKIQPYKKPSVAKPKANSNAARRAELKAQKAALEKRLERLKEVLEQLVDAAKARSGVKKKESEKGKAPETPKDKADRNAAEKKRKPETASQKKERAKKAKEQYEKENPGSLSEDIEILKEQIKDIQAKVQKAMEQSKAARMRRNNAEKKKEQVRPRRNESTASSAKRR